MSQDSKLTEVQIECACCKKQFYSIMVIETGDVWKHFCSDECGENYYKSIRMNKEKMREELMKEFLQDRIKEFYGQKNNEETRTKMKMDISDVLKNTLNYNE